MSAKIAVSLPDELDDLDAEFGTPDPASMDRANRVLDALEGR